MSGPIYGMGKGDTPSHRPPVPIRRAGTSSRPLAGERQPAGVASGWPSGSMGAGLQAGRGRRSLVASEMDSWPLAQATILEGGQSVGEGRKEKPSGWCRWRTQLWAPSRPQVPPLSLGWGCGEPQAAVRSKRRAKVPRLLLSQPCRSCQLSLRVSRAKGLDRPFPGPRG